MTSQYFKELLYAVLKKATGIAPMRYIRYGGTISFFDVTCPGCRIIPFPLLIIGKELETLFFFPVMP